MRRVDLSLLGVAAIWGSSYLAAKTAVAGAGVLPALALRYLLAAGALFVVAHWCPAGRPGRRELAVGVLLGITQAAVLALETFGVSLTSATNAGVLISLTIVLTPLLENVAAHRWLPPAFFVAAVLAIVGSALLVTDGRWRSPTTGDGLVLAASGVRALHVVLLGRLTQGQTFSTLRLTLVQLAVGAAIFTAVSGPQLRSRAARTDLTGWLALGYLALGCSVFAFLVQLSAVRQTSAARASLLMGTEPVWAVAVGLTIGGEALGLVSAAGAVVVVAATAWGQRIETHHRARASSQRRVQTVPTSIGAVT